MTTREQGIVERHSTYCPTHQGGRCSSQRTTGRLCRPTFRAWVYSRGARRKIRSKAFGTLGEARSWRKKALAELERGRRAPNGASVMLQRAAEDWLEGIEAGAILTRSGSRYKPSTARSYRGDFENHLYPALGRRKLQDLTRAEVQSFVDRLVGQGMTAAKIHNIITPLQALCRWSVERDVLWANPLTHVRLPISRTKRERAVSAVEAAELIEALPENDRAPWATALYAGLRLGELRGLRWLEVDLASSVLEVRRSWDAKEGEIEPKSYSGTRRVPLAPHLRDLLAEHKARTRRIGEALVFGATAERPFTPSNLRKRARTAWSRANVSRAEQGRPPLEPLGFHEARHCFVSLAIDAGFSLVEVGSFVGHTSTWMTGRYAHLVTDREAEAAERFGAYLARADTASRVAQLESPAE